MEVRLKWRDINYNNSEILEREKERDTTAKCRVVKSKRERFYEARFMGEDFFRERKRALCLPCRERGGFNACDFSGEGNINSLYYNYFD
jgi:hypothetical protein